MEVKSDFENVVEGYKNSTDEKLVDFARSIIYENLEQYNTRNYLLGQVSDIAIADVRALTGIDVSGFRHNIKGNYVKHIHKRHGKNGIHDHSMADMDDFGRIGYVLDNYDNVKLLHDANGGIVHSHEFKNAMGELSPLTRYEKRINGIVYVVEAVPDSKAKRLQVISAYKEKTKNRGGQVLNMAYKTLQLTSKPPLAATPINSDATSNKIQHPSQKVNTQKTKKEAL